MQAPEHVPMLGFASGSAGKTALSYAVGCSSCSVCLLVIPFVCVLLAVCCFLKDASVLDQLLLALSFLKRLFESTPSGLSHKPRLHVILSRFSVGSDFTCVATGSAALCCDVNCHCQCLVCHLFTIFCSTLIVSRFLIVVQLAKI